MTHPKTKAAAWLIAIVVLAGVVLTVGRTLLILYSVRTGIRFSVQLQHGINEIAVSLARGNYVYEVTTEPNLGLVTVAHENDSTIMVRTSARRGHEIILSESAKHFQAFTVSHLTGTPVKVTVYLDSTNGPPVYLNFRRGL
jgi:hypothetical protein